MISESVLGSDEPRLSTPPLRELKPAVIDENGCVLEDATSYGFDVIEFAERVLRLPLDPWERVAVIRGGELLPSGLPRFRKVLLIVARQNGKTHLVKVLILYWLYVEGYSVLGISTLLPYAKSVWEEVYDLGQGVKALRRRTVGKWTDNNDTRIEIAGPDGHRVYYRIAAMGRKAGRSKTFPRLFIDEIREHTDFETVKAALPTMNAVLYGQAWAATNMGDESAAVLKAWRESGISGSDAGLCLLEWSAPPGADPEDVTALAAANPNLGRRISLAALLEDARAAKASPDPQVLTGFRTEILCQYVPALDPAVDPERWAESYRPGDLHNVAGRVLCFDISPDQQHATIVAGAMLPDGKVRLLVVEAFQGSMAVRTLRDQLHVWVRRIVPAKVGWFPNGPGAVLAADIRERKDRRRPFPASVLLEEIAGEVASVCMGFASHVASDQVIHDNEALLTAQVTGAAKRWNGDVWRFERKGEGHVDAAYAAAGADHLARTLPRAVGKPRIIMASA
jgi:hypothetical protein